MADEISTTWANLLREAKGPLVEALRWRNVLLAEFRRDKNPQRWAGKQITVPIILAPQQGAGMISETGTLNSPHVHDDVQANIKTAIIAVPVSFSTQVLEQAKNDDTSWAQVVPTKMRMAEDALSRIMNEQMVSASGALLCACASNTGSPGLTIPVVATAFNPYQLYPGRIIDVRVRASGNLQTGGSKRKIASVDATASPPTITIDTNAFDGDSGAVTFSANDGVYIEGSYGNALQSVADAVGTTAIFQGINKTNVPQWKGTDASPAAATDPSIAVLDSAERKVRTYAGGDGPSFYLADPAVQDKYQQGLTVQARWAGDDAQLDTGFTGISYRGKVILADYDMPPKTIYGIARDDAAIYALDDGPDWDDRTGSMFQRFGDRKLTLEAWLVWMVQLGFLRCNTFVKIGNMNQAT